MLLKVTNQNSVLGDYNEAISGKLITVFEEAAFAGDKKAFEQMKELITGSRVLINPKHKTPINIDNYSRLVVISNNDHFLNIKPGDRRYTVLESTSAWHGTGMFERLVDQWNNGGAERFVHDALSHSFRRLDERSKLVIQSNLKTPAAVRQVALSRSALEKCIVELLLRGKLSDLHGRGWRMDEPCAIKSQELKSDVSRWLEEHDPRTARHGGTLHTIISTIEKYIGSSTTVARPKGRDPNTGGRIQLPTVRILPPREDALQHALANGLITEEEHRAAHEAAELEEKENDLELENIKVSSRSARLRSRVTGLH